MVHPFCFGGCGVSVMFPTNVVVLYRLFASYIGLVVDVSNLVTGMFILFRTWAKFTWCPIGQTRCRFPPPFVNWYWLAVTVTSGEQLWELNTNSPVPFCLVAPWHQSQHGSGGFRSTVRCLYQLSSLYQSFGRSIFDLAGIGTTWYKFRINF